MAIYRYEKTYLKPKSRLRLYGPWLFFMAGLLALANVIWPWWNYQLQDKSNFSRKILSPTREIFAQAEKNDLVIVDNNLSNWFASVPDLPVKASEVQEYQLSVPSLRIKEALVKLSGQDLSESLIHYPGTAFPGQYGNTVIFGHSSLPHFFNPKNYLTIFSTLPKIRKNDEIIVNYDQVTYLYQVKQIFEVEPDDFSVLEQSYSGRFLSLVTCVPPGTDFRRLVVKAVLK